MIVYTETTETGFYYLRHRSYDHVTAQFATPDPLFNLTGSRYGYAGNDPVNGPDPLGLFGYGTIAAASQGIVGGLGPVMNAIGNDIAQSFNYVVDAVRDNPWEAVAIGVTAAATVSCVATLVGIVGWGEFLAVAYGPRANARIQNEGFSKSLRSNEIDLTSSITLFGIGGFAEAEGGVEGIRPGEALIGRVVLSGPDIGMGIGELATQVESHG